MSTAHAQLSTKVLASIPVTEVKAHDPWENYEMILQKMTRGLLRQDGGRSDFRVWAFFCFPGGSKDTSRTRVCRCMNNIVTKYTEKGVQQAAKFSPCKRNESTRIFLVWCKFCARFVKILVPLRFHVNAFRVFFENAAFLQ